MTAAPSKSLPLLTRIQHTFRSLQFFWFAAHLVSLLLFAHYSSFLLKFASSTKPARIAYRSAFAFSTLAYGVVIYKAHFSKKLPTVDSVQKLRTDENFLYFYLSAIFLMSRPVYVVMLPFAIYSVFHVLTYTRTNLIPTLIPGSPLGSRIGDLVSRFYDSAMGLVAVIELVAILPRLFFGALFGRNRFLVFILYTLFLRTRWQVSPFLKQSLASIIANIDCFVAGQNIPTAVRSVWYQAKAVLNQLEKSASKATNTAGATSNPLKKDS